MALGDYKTEGGKGLNTSWQKAVLTLLSWLRAGETLPDTQNDLYNALEITTNTAQTLFPAVVGGVNVITDLLVTNGSATVGTWVEFRDTNASGTLLWKGYASSAGGGFIQPAMKKPIYQKTKNTPLVVVCLSNSTDTVISANGYKSF